MKNNFQGCYKIDLSITELKKIKSILYIEVRFIESNGV